ncbi:MULTISPECIES: zinc-dependent alcohol dehydrogenase [unclassified Rhizobium]|uniref:zinc-dependent alcohol dehydrogenase n=1 Tax=unclassified Rhizobium TaxID=2613769 RepID=UPI001ADC6F60|nr:MULTISPECIES: zinc-binding dehydrogenase [unclassified Rhizobium]MBO9101657.1 zinc-binding dehydrogenase [Rhizobium sp. L58/93]MBO9187650.1 zinc-binding dehydrogenase [Rhizobium sp. E27B/91]QXZ86573.1 zinc-binding dehydrogenase [Rhizobium sp. K1/93]QXZ93394.1 zinc-binding dehydrogenase [Rhizobium sp. K15/93]
MKALVFEAPDRPAIVDVAMPEVSANEVLVRTRAVGICHSDYELLAGRYIIPTSYPVTPGHEWSGEIVEVGRNVTGFKVGDRVVGECVVRTPERLHHFGFSMSGADREFFNVNPEWLHKLPDAVDDKKAALIEPFTCGFYAMLRSGGTNASETVVVSGGGTIGLVSAAAAIGMGARVIVVDPLAARRDVALRLGADAALDPSDGGAADRIREMTGGHGADLVVEASGHDASLAAAFDYAREDGRMSMVGINIGRKVPVVIGQIQMKNLTVRGCIGSPGVWPAAIRFLERTGIDLSPIQTHDYALTDAVDAFSFGKDATKSIKITLLNN